VILQTGDNLPALANLLQIDHSKVRSRYRGSGPATINAAGRVEVQPGRTDMAFTIIALGDLSFGNGLPALGQLGDQFSLKSGEALHFLGDVRRVYEGKGGLLLLLQWSNLGD